MTDSDDAPRYVLAARLMFGSPEEAQSAVSRIEDVTGAIAIETFIEEV